MACSHIPDTKLDNATVHERGRLPFELYREYIGCSDYTHNPIPPFQDLSHSVQGAWAAVRDMIDNHPDYFEHDDEHAGETAYWTYADYVLWKNRFGEPLDEYRDMPIHTKMAWIMCSSYIRYVDRIHRIAIRKLKDNKDSEISVRDILLLV